MPLLSLCLATYNRARYLRRYLAHHLEALEAAGVDYELVVSDNASTDETPEILAEFAALYPRVRVSRQARNLGAHPNILTTLRQATGEVVVSIADDDLAIVDQLLAYVRRMQEDPTLVMIQAPWLLMDERKDNAIIGQFYRLDCETRFGGGRYGDCLAFLIQRHIFPECWIARRSALAAVAGPSPRFAYSYFWMLASALSKGDVLFCPEPHVMATAVSKGDNTHVGNSEAMESWDLYRGGLELMASYARQSNPTGWADAASLGAAIQGFVIERTAVAARLQAHAGNWSNAYQLLRRMHAYDETPAIDHPWNDVAVLAAVETALVECSERGASDIVVAEAVPDNILDRMRPIDGVRILRPGGTGAGEGPRAYIGVQSGPDAALRPQDLALDLAEVMERFPRFPG